MDRESECCGESAPVRVTRRTLLRSASALAGGLALTSAWPQPVARAAESAAAVAQDESSGGVVVRWLGAGVVEVATADSKQIAYVDAWVWKNSGWDRFGVQKAPEYSSPDAFAEYIQSRNPEAVLVLLSHDHPDHMGDFFEMLSVLSGAGVNVKAVGLSDFLRSPTGLLPRFQEAGLELPRVVVNNGAGSNYGGRSIHGGMQAFVVPAYHSTTSGYPAIGFILDVGGVRFYASGDTDLYGDMQLIGQRYQPNVALVCAGGGPFTMDPRGAALACQLLGVSQAVPIHYGHTAALSPQAGEEFRQALAELSPDTTAQVLVPGQTTIVG
jgi:L-ascorbate metabolism protein UlaG (beta-lactamase superfamily)